MNRSGVIPIAIAAIVLIIICCICIAITIGSAYMLNWNSTFSADNITVQHGIPTNTPVVVRPTGQLTPSPQESIITPAIESNTTGNPGDTLRSLRDAVVPINDPADLARRLEGKENIPLTLEPPDFPFQTGDQQSFWINNSDTNETFKVQAVLRYVTDHAYFWIEDGVPYNEKDLQNLAEIFENQIYPTNREFFGSEWSPGIDGDQHLYVLYARGLGNTVAGYFSSRDSYNPLVVEYSNGHEMFVFNADNTHLRQDYTYGVLAHELQHMIHWYRDRNESSWLNEGFSDLAMFLNGYDIGGHDYIYAHNPDIQLNDWPNDSSQTVPHYGASFLFTTYFLDRFGEDATKMLVAHPANGMDSLDQVLRDVGAMDPLTGSIITADDFFLDWVLTSFLQDDRIDDGRYTYHNYPDAPAPSPTENIRSCDGQTFTRDVRQYGVDYISIICRGDATLHFGGSTQVGVIPADPYSGAFAFWSNKGDESDMTLTQAFDFTDHEGPLTLSYWTWYDIEEDYDYLYLEASLDGENWTMLSTPSGTAVDPTGANYGWGYTGLSGSGSSWIQENVDLSQYAGKEVRLRFEYVTDTAVHGEGLLLDDISIPEIDYFTDLESDDGGWESAGFVRIQNVLPQNFRVALISIGETTTVEQLDLSKDNVLDLPLSFKSDVDEVILVVTGTTRSTRQPATYRFNLFTKD
jgi:immune inhibitor A